MVPATPQAVALYLGRLAAAGQSLASAQLARSVISQFPAAAGIQKGDSPVLHPVVTEAVKGFATGPRHPGRPTLSPPTPWPGSGRSSACPEGAVGDGWSRPKPPGGGPPSTW